MYYCLLNFESMLNEELVLAILAAQCDLKNQIIIFGWRLISPVVLTVGCKADIVL